MVHRVKKAFVEAIRILSQWRLLGETDGWDGSREVGSLPHIGELAYLHNICGPLSEELIEYIGDRIGVNLPNDLKELYRCANGLSVFQGMFSIYGTTATYTVESSQIPMQPYNVEDLNYPWNRTKSLNDVVFFASYANREAMVYIDQADRIFKVAEDDKTVVLQSWPDLGTWLLEEVKRGAALFDESGRRISEEDASENSPIKNLGSAPSMPVKVDDSTVAGRFVAKWVHPDYLPEPAASGDFEAIECELGFFFPAAYRRFMETWGSVSTKFSLLNSIVEHGLDVDALSSFLPADEIVETTLRWRDAGLPKSLVAVAANGSGDLFCFDTRENRSVRQEDSKVYFWDHDLDYVEAQGTSFDAWLEMLTNIEEVED